MKKIVSLMLTAFIAVQCLTAQVPEGIKYMNYARYKSARDAFQKAYNANPKDAQTIYWLGQSILATDGATPATPQQLQEAKALYQKGLQETGSDPWLLVGMGQIELMEGGDLNSAKQKFEQAITASTATSGKTKGKPNPAILAAIGRANASLPSGKGDNVYAIDKLKQAAVLDPANADIYINLGINYLKMGGENGGEAVKAFQEALARDPKNAFAYYRIGKIYQSQNNKELFEQNFNSAIGVDPAFPQVYNALFDYYASRDVNKAKEYLDKYIANADKSPENDVYLAEYLFRAQKNQESLAKLKEVEAAAGGSKNLPAINLLYAYNYDRLGDSVQAKANLEKYFANPASKIRPEDYELAVTVFSKFPGSETTAISYLEKAMANDTSKVNRIAYQGQIATLYGKAKMYPQQLDAIQKQIALKGNGAPMSEFDYYTLTSTAFNAKLYPQTIDYAKAYIKAFPDKTQPFRFYKLAAIASDPDSTSGTGVDYLNTLDSIYLTMDKEKYKVDVFRNQNYIMGVYLKKMSTLNKNSDFKVKSDGTRTPVVDEYIATAQKVVALTEAMMALYPDPADENNKYAQNVKADMQKRIDYYSKPPARKSGGTSAGAGTAGKGK
ncbi:MAG: hypothetical protein JO301_11160 [Chitinophagaceae bacterium]|nr:hypothetical protein [Chitinophagaceae bacterium]